MSDIILKHFSVDSFMGIDHTKPVLIDFTARRNRNKNIAVLQGNQGTGKTSTMTALMYALGATFKIDQDNFINQADGTIKSELEFEVEGIKYRVNATKSRFQLEMFVDAANKWMKVDEPKTTMQKLVGHLGTSPMPLKEKDGEKQIDWFRETFGDEEVKGKEKKILKGIEETKTTRRDANREYIKLKNSLALSDLYRDYEQNQKKFVEPPSIEAAKTKMDSKKDAARQYDRAVEALDNYKTIITAKHHEIDEIKKKLLKAEEDLQLIMQRQADGQKYVADNATVKVEYEEAEKEFIEISQTLADHSAWQEVVRQKKEMEEYETIIQRADATKDELIAKLRKLTKKYLPEIEGLEIKLNTF